MKRLIHIAAVVLLMSSEICSASPVTLNASLKKHDDYILYSIRNQGPDPVAVYELDFVFSHRKRHWVFLYDPATKEIQEGWNTVFDSPAMRAKMPPTVLLNSQDEVSKTYLVEDLLSLFFVVPKCFYLVAVYRPEMGNDPKGVVSNALYICRTPHR